MNKLSNILKTLLYSMLLLCCISGFAQIDKYNRAQQLYLEKNFDAAKLTIDSVIVHPETKADYMSWTTRAYIYFDLYKRTDKNKLYSALRDTIISSIKMSNSLKPDETYLTNNKKLLVSISGYYYNIAKTLLNDSVNYQRSVIAYNKYKELFKFTQPEYNFNVEDIRYYLAVGSLYAEIFNKNNKNKDAHDIARLTLLKVLDIEPNHPSANMNLGLMYYNQAVNFSKELDFADDINELDVVQENVIKLAKQAEQFAIKAYNADHKNTKAVIVLYFIYKTLNDQQKEQEFKNKCKELNID